MSQRRVRSSLSALLLVALAMTACTKAPVADPANPTAPASGTASSVGSAASSGGASSSVTAATTPATTKPTTATAKPTPVTKPVHVALLENDGGTYGVGMPIIAWFSVAPTDAKAFAKATAVTVNGKPATGAWYFEQTAHAGAALEAHFRPQAYWPAHSAIKLDLPIKGLTAGPGLSFDDSLTLSISIGAAHVSTVDAQTLTMTVLSDGQLYGRFPVSLGASNTPTARGTKVIMDKGRDISMSGPGYYDAHVQWTQRLTYGGEYLHSAPWNVGNIGHRSTSNGCTNLLPSQAKQLYDFLSIGDVVLYPNASGPAMTLGAGYGDWNVGWSQWLTGGALATVRAACIPTHLALMFT